MTVDGSARLTTAPQDEDEREASRLRGIASRKLLRGKLPAEWPTVYALWPKGSAVAQRDLLADAIEEYMLWEPGRAGHAAAHRALVAALRKVRSS